MPRIKIFTMVRFPPNSGASRANSLHWLQQHRIVVVNSPAIVDALAKTRYVFRDPICFIIMYRKILAVLLMLSSLLDLCMLIMIFSYGI